MKLRKLLIIAFTFIFVSIFAVSFKVGVNTVETSELIIVQGAQIRTTGNAGIRFVAKEEYEGTNETAYGIILAYGEAEANEQFVIDGTVNGKAVLKGEVTNTKEGVYTVTLYNVPEEAYTQVVTARAYVIDGGNAIYSQNVTVKSLAEVALKAKNDGNNAELVNTVVTAMEGYKKVFVDAQNRKYVVSAKYEADYRVLAKLFIADWNEMFATELTEASFLGGSSAAFYASAKTSSETDWTGSKLVTFFQNEAMKAKWGWVFDLITAKSTNSYAKAQITAIKTNVPNEAKWYRGAHLTSALMSLFAGSTQTSGYGGGLSTSTNYTILPSISTYNQVIYADLADSQIVEVGSTINLPAEVAKDYYDWKGYQADSLYAANAEYIVTDNDILFAPTYTPTQYTVKFYDGAEELTTLELTYDIEDVDLALPTLTKANHVFDGWYADKGFETEVVTKIAAGSNGNKVLYAKFTEISGYTITYNFNGGNTKYPTYDAVVTDLLVDLSAYYGKELNAENIWDSTYKASGTMMYDFFYTSATYATKWSWLGEYLLAIRLEQISDNSDMTAKTDSAWRSEVFGFVTKGQRTEWPASCDYSSAETQAKHLTYLSKPEKTEYLNQTGETTLLTNVYKAGYTFAGWYTDAEFTGERVYTVNGATTLYAKWEAQ